MDFRMHPIEREIVIDGFHSIYYFEFGKDFSHPPERHDFWELVYVDSGKINALVNAKAQTLSQGEVIFHRPSEMHAHVSNRKDPNCMLVVSFSTKSEAMQFFAGKIFSLDKTAKTVLSLFIREARHALGELPGDYKNRDPLDFSAAMEGSFQLLECYLTEFLLLLKRSAIDNADVVKPNESSRALTESSIMELIVNYLAEHLDISLTLADLCSRFYLGKSQLYKLCAEHLGMGPIEYHNRLKITEAKKMLLRAEHSVTKIADMLAYSSIHSFSRSFKASVGVSPTEYQKRITEERT